MNSVITKPSKPQRLIGTPLRKANRKVNFMKIGLFSDPHYCKSKDLGMDRRAILSYDKVKEAMEEFVRFGVDLCICMGDLTDHKEGDTKKDSLDNLNEILSLIRSYNLPFYFVPGNHDYLMLSGEDLKNANLDTPPYVIATKEYNLIALDPNYRSNMERFDKAGVVWDDANLPLEQMEFLKNALDRSDKECISLLHENLDPTVQEQHIIKNAEQIRKIIRESSKVKAVIQGHYHEGSDWFENQIHYHTVKGMCQGESNPYEIIII